ncbi:MAG: hypothetical protein MK135_02835 [Polyangiaceae bacterium]|nr:hypothetical protein [Polyangiaceae bacterium]
MKLHFLKLRNLNSLYGDHQVDFEGALGDVSLFLIHGPTGAGKSTIMDAVSLSLFGETPRLDRQGGVASRQIGEIMSRGTAEAFSELTFSKIEKDGSRGRYRAEFFLRRARKKPDGKFQSPVRALYRWDQGDWVQLAASAKVKEYQQAFSEVLEGFSTLDFQRSMLLAQGQFDRFLAATSLERAQLLERLTDTGDYQKLGARAAQLNSVFNRRLKLLGGQISEAQAPSASEFQESQATRQRGAEELSLARDYLAKVGVAERWKNQCQSLASNYQSALDEEKELQRREQGFQEMKLRLAQHERGQPGFSLIDQVVARSSELKRDRVKSLELLKETEAVAAPLPGLAELAEKNARVLDRTHELQPQLLSRWERLQSCFREFGSAFQRVEQLDRRLKELNRVEEKTENDLRAIIAAGRRIGRQMSQMNNGEEMLDCFHELGSSFFAEKKTMPCIGDGDFEAQSIKSAQQKFGQDLELLTKWASAQDSLLKIAVTQLEKELTAAREDYKGLKSIKTTLQERNQFRRQLTVLEGELPVLEQRVQAAADELRSREKEQSQLNSLDRERQKLLRAQEQLAAIALQRDVLEDGKPCPLCGSLEHPAQLIAQAEERSEVRAVEETRRALLQGEERLRKVSEELKLAQGKSEKLRVKRELLGEEIQREKEKVRHNIEVRGEEFLSFHLSPECTLEEVEQRLEEKTQEGASRQKTWTKAEELAQGFSSLRAELGELRPHWASTRTSWQEQSERRKSAEREKSDLQQDLVQQREAYQEAAHSWQAFWEQVLASEPSAPELHDDWLQKQKSTEAYREAKAALFRESKFDPKKSGISPELSLLWQKMEEPLAQHLRLTSFAQEAKRNQQESRERYQRAQERVQQLEKEISASEALVQSGSAAVKSLNEELDHWLKGACLESVEELKALRLSSEVVAKAQQERLELGRLVSQLEAKLLERQTALKLHQKSEKEVAAPFQEQIKDSILELNLVELKSEAEQDVRRKEEQLSRLSDVVAQLQERRRQEQELRSKLEKLRDEAAIWARLNSLIGRNEGGAFQMFAQALNLRRLVNAANRHLERLSKRYRLEQKKENGELSLEFQVQDLYQVGSQRSTRSLSGGERFLISLALALGLSDLKTKTMPIETLLLDEGFGTLDGETLEVAIQALGYLQGDGRQVGIISHVNALLERIDSKIALIELGGGKSTLRVQC